MKITMTTGKTMESTTVKTTKTNPRWRTKANRFHCNDQKVQNTKMKMMTEPVLRTSTATSDVKIIPMMAEGTQNG